MRRTARWIAIAVAVIGGLAFAEHIYMESWRAPTRRLWNQVSIGDTEARVREALGKPVHEYEAETAPADYYVSGWMHKERPITGKVLIYMEKDLILYLWLDEAGHVEDRFVGRS